MRRLLIAMFVIAIGALLGAGPAAAHSVVVSSEPPNGDKVAAGPDRVSVTFNEALQESFAALTVTGPDGNLWSTGEPAVQGATVSVGLGELGPVGEYTVAYRVTSADGHPVSGTRTFALTQAGNGTPAATTEPTDESEGGIRIWAVPILWFAVVAVVLFAAGLAFVLRKPKNG